MSLIFSSLKISPAVGSPGTLILATVKTNPLKFFYHFLICKHEATENIKTVGIVTGGPLFYQSPKKTNLIKVAVLFI